MLGTLLGATTAVRAFRIVDNGKIVYYGNGSGLALFCAKSAGNTALVADFANFLSLLMIAARDEIFCAFGNSFYYLFRTGRDTSSAFDAFFLRHFGIAFRIDSDRVVVTCVDATSHSEASPRALFAPSRKKFHTAAVPVSYIVVFILRLVSSPATNHHPCGNARVRGAENGGDFVFFLF